MPLTQEMLDKYIAEHGPWAYHTTGHTNVESIEQEGITYSEDRIDTGDAGSREEHVYLYVGAARNFAQFRVDLRKLDAEHFMLDTDAASVMDDWKESYAEGEAAVYFVKDRFEDHPHWDEPENVLKGMVEHHTFAYKADIPPVAIERHKLYWDEERNIQAYEKAIGQRQQHDAQMEEVARKYREAQEALAQSPDERRCEDYVWTVEGDVYKQWPSHFASVSQAQIPEEVKESMHERGYLSRSDYDIRVFMEKNAEDFAGGNKDLLYSPAKDQLGMAYLQHKARLEDLDKVQVEPDVQPQVRKPQLEM